MRHAKQIIRFTGRESRGRGGINALIKNYKTQGLPWSSGKAVLPMWEPKFSNPIRELDAYASANT